MHWPNEVALALRSIEIDIKAHRESVKAMLGTNVQDFELLPDIVSCSSLIKDCVIHPALPFNH